MDVIDEIQNEQGDKLKALKVSDIKPKLPPNQSPGLQNLIQKLKANAAAKLNAQKTETKVE